jgi:hypothetical protein
VRTTSKFLHQRLHDLHTDERGGAHTAATVVLFPLFMVITPFISVQAILWRHDRLITRAVATEASAALALYGSDQATVVNDAQTRLTRSGLTHITITVSNTGGLVDVTISARTRGIIIGTTTDVNVHAATPQETWQPA